MKHLLILFLFLATPCFAQKPLANLRAQPYDQYSLRNPYGAGSRFRPDGLLNPYSRYGSRFSNHSWNNPYATRPPKIYSGGRYYGEFSTNRWRRDSVSNRYGRFGSPYSPQSFRNPYGLGNPYQTQPPVWVYPAR